MKNRRALFRGIYQVVLGTGKYVMAILHILVIFNMGVVSLSGWKMESSSQPPGWLFHSHTVGVQ